MNIKDPDVKRAISTLIDEFENKEAEVEDLEKSEQELSERVEELENRVAQLEDQVAELEEALAEAYLTSEVDDGIQGKDVELSPGCGTDVPDPASDEAVD
jgi:predicted  nucleic acid-binding Zn-ribbon protein